MTEVRHTIAGRLVCNLCAGPLLDRAFREVRIMGEADQSGLPVLLVANHFSWWDGFIQYRLNRALLHRRPYVLMLEEQLLRHPVLRGCGCVPVRKHSRSMIGSLDYGARLLRDGRNMLLLFPQGEIQSMHLPRLHFESGLGYLLRHVEGKFRIGFNVNLPDYSSCRRPALYVFYEGTSSALFSGAAEVEEAFNRFYGACKERLYALP